jgi:hypothetical protein
MSASTEAFCIYVDYYDDPNQLTSLKVSINGAAYVTLPYDTDPPYLVVPPNATLQFQANTGNITSNGYYITIVVGGVSVQWDVGTGAPVPTIITPAITSPAPNATDLNPNLNTPSAVNIVGTTYNPVYGAGTPQTSSEWEVYKWVGSGSAVPPTLNPPGANYTAVTGSPFTVSASPFTTVSIPEADLTISSTYYARVKYATTNATAVTSNFSAWSSFATAAAFTPAPGTAMSGGYFAGQIRVFAGEDGGGLPTVDTIYNLIVAPVDTGQHGGSIPSGIQYKTTLTGDLPAATFQNKVYGLPANDAGNDADHPMFQWARSLNIGGFSDWYIPAVNELEILYYYLKPTTELNSTNAVNPNAYPLHAYYPLDPGQTTSALFKTGGAQAFIDYAFYQTSTEYSGTDYTFWLQRFDSGTQAILYKASIIYFTTPYVARAIRRVAA